MDFLKRYAQRRLVDHRQIRYGRRPLGIQCGQQHRCDDGLRQHFLWRAARNAAPQQRPPGFFISLDLELEQRLYVEGLLGICIEQAVFPLDNNYRPSVSGDMQFIDYQTNMAVQISKIITGERPVDDWDAILEGWYAAGGDSYVAEMRAYITENQSK